MHAFCAPRSPGRVQDHRNSGETCARFVARLKRATGLSEIGGSPGLLRRRVEERADHRGQPTGADHERDDAAMDTQSRRRNVAAYDVRQRITGAIDIGGTVRYRTLTSALPRGHPPIDQAAQGPVMAELCSNCFSDEGVLVRIQVRQLIDDPLSRGFPLGVSPNASITPSRRGRSDASRRGLRSPACFPVR